MTVDQSYLNKYFAQNWTGGAINFNQSGLTLASKVRDNEWLLDVGCGRNPFKGIVPNMVGIDPAFNEADIKCTIEEYHPERKFDVAFCLGSINFGTLSDVTRQIEKVIYCLQPSSRIYWRCNPGLQDHDNVECTKIDFFPWSIELHQTLSTHYGFTVTEIKQETIKKRIYAEWIR